MRENIIGENDIGLTDLSGELACFNGSKETFYGGNAVALPCNLGNGCGRFDARYRNAAPFKKLQKIAIIACDFDHVVALVKFTFFNQLFDMCACMFDKARRD